MPTRFIIDSASDILPEECTQLGITHLPMTVTFGEEAYEDSVTLTHSQFYEKLAQCPTLPTTSQISPAVFSDAMAQAVAEGNDVVVITMSSRLSGTYQSACIAADDFPDRVFVVDSLSVSLGERILLQRGLELASQGLSAQAIAEALDEEKQKIRLFALLDTLEYLKKGGRISAATAVAGSLLSIKPVIAVEDGSVVMAGKARGTRQGCSLLLRLTEDAGIDNAKPLCLAYSGLSDEGIKAFAQNPLFVSGQIASVGATIGTHVGPDVMAVAFYTK